MSAPEAIDFEPRGALRELFTRRDPELLVEGPAGTGKSRAILELWHLRCLKYPGARVLFARKTRRSMTQSTLVTFERGVRPHLDGVIWRAQEQEYRYPNGSRIVVAGLDEPTRVYSTEYDGAYVNEATEVDLDDWETVSGRLRNGVIPYQQLVGDCNPASPLHWLHRRTLEPHPETGEVLTASLLTTHRDNARIYGRDGTPTEYGRAYLARLERLTGHRRARLLLGQWVGAEGRVYDNWERTAESVRARPADELASWRRLVSLDIGVRNPTAILGIYWAADGRSHVGHEAFRPGMSAGEVVTEAAALARAIGAEVVLIDPSAAGYRLDLEAELAGECEVRAADNDRRRGVQLCREAVDLGLTVDPSCANFLREIDAYHYREGSATDDPEKIDDHAMDAWRYGVVYAAEPELHGRVW